MHFTMDSVYENQADVSFALPTFLEFSMWRTTLR